MNLTTVNPPFQPSFKPPSKFAVRSTHSSALKTIVLAGVFFGACNSLASEALARKNDCLACHAVAINLVGPAFMDVAAKYAGQSDAADRLSESIRNGGSGKWGEMQMPAQPKLSKTDLKKLVIWVLSAK